MNKEAKEVVERGVESARLCLNSALSTPNTKNMANALLLLSDENKRLRGALELIAIPKRSDGTYNRCREACEVLAREALEGEK